MQKGFSLIELLIVTVVLLIITTISVSAFRFFQKESDLNNAAEEIINTLRLAQNKTLASEGASQYGVHFETEKYVLFKGINYDPLAPDNEIHNLPKSVKILNGGIPEVVFNRVTGETSQSGNVKIGLVSDPSKTRTISIDFSGRVILGEGVSPTALPEKDSRHVHFDLRWPIQDATDLKFYFPSVPPAKTVGMANYFNVAKTEFDWNNEISPFVVNGKNQVFRVHSHSLDASSALLCIHRDRNEGKNDQEVIIYIVDSGVDKEIAHYSAATVEKGIYVNTMEIQ